MIKPDSWIRKMAIERGMIEPFEEKQVSDGAISFGLSSFGYDVRIADEFRVLSYVEGGIIDPKSLGKKSFTTFRSESCIIPPNSFSLARSFEYFRIPRNVIALCVGKSTYARCGILANITPLEPEWEGYITIAISNISPFPTRIYAFEGIAQVLFFECDTEPEFSYADKKGKYQAQKKITHPKL